MIISHFAPEGRRLLFAIHGEAGIATSLSGTSWAILATPGLVPGESYMVYEKNTLCSTWRGLLDSQNIKDNN